MPPTSPKPELPLGDWLLLYAKERMQLVKRGEDLRTQTSVSLQRRFRGASLSDQIGCFITGGSGLWRGDQSEDLEGMAVKSLNITKPTIQMNMSALSSARVAINNEAANKEPPLKGAANVADGISSFLNTDDRYWTGSMISRYAQLIQTGYGAFVQVRHNKDKKAPDVAIQEMEDDELTMEGEYACSCGSKGLFTPSGDYDEDSETTPCPECGEQAEVIKAPETDTVPRPTGVSKFNPGDIEMRISSCFEHRVDERNSQAGNLLLAEWFEHHYLVTPESLEREFKGFEFGDPTEWCYSLRWKWALETGDDVFQSNYQADDYRRRYERRDIYVLPEQYCHRVEPADWQLLDGEGNVVISVERGDRLEEKYPNGFCYTVVNERIAPYWRKVDFRDEWTYGCFLPDAHSFWGQPLVQLLQIQDDHTTLYTIDIQHRERNSITQIIHNNQMFDPDAFEQDIVSTAEGVTQEQPLDFYFKQTSPAPMNEAAVGMELLYKMLPYIGGAPPEAVGVDPPGDDNYSAQLLRKQSSLGQLQPAGESMASCKVRTFRNFYKLAQDLWPFERFEYLRTRFGEEWKDDDIEAFLNCDIDRDVISNYVEGTEIPTSFIERRMDIEAAIGKFIEAQLPPPPELIRQWFDMMDLDFDMGGEEADERLADARYETIKKGLKQLTGKLPEEPTVTIDPMSGQPVQGPSVLIQAVMSHPQLKVLPKENHGIAIKFYVAHEKATMAQEMPDMNLIECCEEQIRRHEMGGVEETQTTTAAEIAGQAPALMAQQALQSGEADPNQQAAQEADQQAAMESQKQAADADKAAQDREASMADAEAQRSHERAMKEQDHAHQSKMESLKILSQERLAMAQAKERKEQAKSNKAA